MKYSNETSFCKFSLGMQNDYESKKVEQSEKCFHLVELVKGLFELCIEQLIEAAGHLVP